MRVLKGSFPSEIEYLIESEISHGNIFDGWEKIILCSQYRTSKC